MLHDLCPLTDAYLCKKCRRFKLDDVKCYYIDNIVFCNTRKGYGVQRMEEDIKLWHYKKIETSIELQSLAEERQAT